MWKGRLAGMFLTREWITGQAQQAIQELGVKHMSGLENTWSVTDLVQQMARGRVSRVTLALLLHTRFAVSQSVARTSALARLTQATDGLISAAEDYERRVSTSASLLMPASTFHMWLTQYATIHGFLLASGANPHAWSSTRQRVEGIRRMSEAQNLIDVDAFTTKAARARILTRWALGDGRFSYDTDLQTMSDRIWQAETELRSGSAPTSVTGLLNVGFSPRGRQEKPPRGRKLEGWTQMTFDDLTGSERP